MVRRAYTQRSLVEVLLPDADKLWDPTLRRIDALLDDEVLVDRIADALARRHPQSRRRGRLGTPAAVVLRLLVLKHLYDWSFDECEREVRGHLVYRAFCRIDGERVPDAKTLIRLAPLLDEAVLKDVLTRLVMLGRTQGLIRGRRLRVDTTVVETNIHYPTDSTLLADGVRVLTRTVRRLGAPVRERARSIARRVFEIAQRSRTTGGRTSPALRERTRARMKVLYQGLLRITRGVVRDAETVVRHLTARPRPRVQPLVARLQATLAVVRQVLAQTRARVLRGDTHYPHKVVSVFEPHTEILRKGSSRTTTCVSAAWPIAPSGCPRSIGTSPCSPARRGWQWPMAALPRRRMNTRPGLGACGTLCCRGTPARRGPAPPARPCAGAPEARDASVPSSGVTGCAGVGTVERPACSAGSGWAPSPTTSRSSAGPGRAPRDTRWEGLDTMKGGAGKTERTNRDHAPHVAPLAPVRHHFCTGK